MALWSNTATGWGSDPSSSGNGALATYLQSSVASAPKSQSKLQVQDPSNSAPTTSIARTVMPTQTQTTTSTMAPNTASVYTPSTNFVAPAAVAAPTYSGPQVVAFRRKESNQVVDYIYKVDPTTGSYIYAGRKDVTVGAAADAVRNAGIDPVSYWAAKPNDKAANAALSQLSYGNVTNLGDGTNQLDMNNLAGQANSQYADALKTYQDQNAAVIAQNRANLKGAQDTAAQQNYLDYLYAHNGQAAPALGFRSLDSENDDKLRANALAEYQANETSAAGIRKGIAPVDTSTQDAINQASIGAIASRFSTNLFGANIAATGNLYANAITDQSGVNKQLSDEDYANRFNQNLAVFTQAVQNQSTVDASATGQKLQSDIQAVSDTVDKLNQQVTQLGTSSGLKVSGQLNALQGQINKYNEAVQEFGASSSTAMGWAKIILGAAAAVTAIALAPVTGGASIVAGAAAGAAIAKA